MLKSNKGISLTTMVITVLIMIIILSTLTYSAVDSIKIRRLNKLYNDIRQLNDAVAVYYLKHNELPIDSTTSIIVTQGGSIGNNNSFLVNSGVTTLKYKDNLINPNDYGEINNTTNGMVYGIIYYKINLELLENLSLNYGKNGDSSNKDYYIINSKSHTIYYYKGVTVDGETYHSLPITYRDVNL
jgi:type II secretory pathway pseudopilin PulG